jgi:L-lactate dehydrogenase complex protein LldF
MTLHPTSHAFKANAARALADPQLQRALGNVRRGFIDKRRKAAEALPEFEALRDEAKAIKDHTLRHLDLYLEAYEEKVRESGGHVHFARNAAEARDIVLRICREAGAKTVTKGKTMVAEEIGLNAHLEANGVMPVETDLGEYIIQLRDEMPSHIIAPAVHLNATQVEADFRRVHSHLPPERDLSEPVKLSPRRAPVLARAVPGGGCRQSTGRELPHRRAGTSVIVTHEGNGGDLTPICADARGARSVEKIVRRWRTCHRSWRAARSGEGQEISVLHHLLHGPRRADLDGPADLPRGHPRQRALAMLGTFSRRCSLYRCGLHEPCPDLSRGRRARLRLVYPGPMGGAQPPP